MVRNSGEDCGRGKKCGVNVSAVLKTSTFSWKPIQLCLYCQEFPYSDIPLLERIDQYFNFYRKLVNVEPSPKIYFEPIAVVLNR